ncbi:uracil-DNA glycosylase family protein [Azohydromonas caseinilytica]|uniref:Uracil-DNA glycosylase n=1 Tax=Azohydromonas caseinilytica TaxID=2728836 RepID=A0A848F8B5_9BURK|nr:uracil-DNA glycosylase family protein [Azohydromonas caseinilytica]NML14955.1 uracil-DNA glycosylase [Azohydromonas caseinilytica]
MLHPFDPGGVNEPFRSLCADYPGPEAYPESQFRVEWGPIFHRGRLDGSARVLVIGQDPAQHETIVRRILVGEAGRRVQGLLARLGITRSYVCINTYLYSVYGSVRAATRRGAGLVSYRHRWLQAVLGSGQVEAVITLGQAAREAWELWQATPEGQAVAVAFAAVTHPTQPESSGHNAAEVAQATAALLQNWNAALQALAPALQHPDTPTPLAPYGTAWAEGDRLPIPEEDFPAGLPAWMHENDGWARRVGSDALAKRRNITLTVPSGVLS